MGHLPHPPPIQRKVKAMIAKEDAKALGQLLGEFMVAGRRLESDPVVRHEFSLGERSLWLLAGGVVLELRVVDPEEAIDRMVTELEKR